jgi:flagellar biosynthetic protein FliR
MPALFTAPFIAFVLVLARVGGMVLTAPLFGSQEIPARMRFLLAFALSLMVTPMQLTTPFVLPTNLVQFALSLGGEILIGGLLGFGVTILLGGAQLAGQIISQMSGLSLAEVFDPTIEQEVPAIANFLNLIALAVFVIIGGHRLLLGAVLDTYTLIPVGHAAAPPALGTLIPTLLTECFSLAVRGAAPAIVALMLATIVLGLISRTLPQLNVMAIGFGLNTLVSFVALAVSIGAVAWLFQEQLEPAVQAIVEALRPNV